MATNASVEMTRLCQSSAKLGAARRTNVPVAAYGCAAVCVCVFALASGCSSAVSRGGLAATGSGNQSTGGVEPSGSGDASGGMAAWTSGASTGASTSRMGSAGGASSGQIGLGAPIGTVSSVDASVADGAAPSPASDAEVDVVADGPSASRQTPRPVGTTRAALGYYEYLPPGYGDGIARPLLLFFHGVGENGNGSSDLPKVLANGPPKLIAMNQWPSSRPFVVLSPQHPPVSTAPDPIYGGFDCWTPAEIHDFIPFATANYAVDTRRIYITALSCGAMGSENYLRQYGTQQGIVASALISGNATIAWQGQGCSLVEQMALWAFHGNADTTVPISGDNMGMQEFMACPMPRKDVMYTVYPGLGHDAWTQTYDLSSGNDIYTWLLGFSQ